MASDPPCKPTPVAPPVPRRPTPPGPPVRPAEYSFTDEEEPTQPGSPVAGDRWDLLSRLFANLTSDERHALLGLADNWFNCDAGERAVLQATAARFAQRR